MDNTTRSNTLASIRTLISQLPDIKSCEVVSVLTAEHAANFLDLQENPMAGMQATLIRVMRDSMNEEDKAAFPSLAPSYITIPQINTEN